MARKSAAAKKTSKQTSGKLENLAHSVVEAAKKRKDPSVRIPMRTLSNAKYNKTKRIIEMGDAAQDRRFFNLAMAKSFMQTLLVASACKDYIDEDKTGSIRQVYYKCKHTI